MDTIKRIEISNTNRWAFSNAIHSRFQKKMYEIVMSDIVPISTLNIKAELLSEWKAYVDLDLDHNREVKSSALTKVLQYKDVKNGAKPPTENGDTRSLFNHRIQWWRSY